MKVFISSVISGMEDYRAAAREAIESLGHAAIAAEDFGASPNSPQQVCLAGVRDADVIALLLGARYGTPQASGLSPTHEEYREARGAKPILVFAQTGITTEPGQDRFIEETGTWEGGGYRQTFDTPSSLRSAVVRAIHDWELSQQAGPVNEDELKARAAALLPRESANTGSSPVLWVAVAGAPTRQVLRPSDIDNAQLHRDIQQEALFGQRPIFDTQHGVQASVTGNTLAVRQPNAEIALDEQGSIRISLPARDTASRRPFAAGIASIVEEDVRDRITNAIHYCGWLLDRIDPAHRLSRIALTGRVSGVSYLPWRTRAEVAASPNSATMNPTQRESAESSPVVLARAALLFDGARQAEDMTVRFRRQAGR
jgi:hypothetical protein